MCVLWRVWVLTVSSGDLIQLSNIEGVVTAYFAGIVNVMSKCHWCDVNAWVHMCEWCMNVYFQVCVNECVIFVYTFFIHNFHILLWSKCIVLSLIIVLEKENLACRGGEGKSSMHIDVVCWSMIMITFCYFSAVWVWAFGYDAFAYCFWYGARRICSKNRHLLA